MAACAHKAGRIVLGRLLGTAVVAVVLTAVPVGAFGAYAQPADDVAVGISLFGNAVPSGSPFPSHLNAPLAGMAPTADGKGYWLVGADGGVFAYGDADFHGSDGGAPPASSTPVVAISATPDGGG